MTKLIKESDRDLNKDYGYLVVSRAIIDPHTGTFLGIDIFLKKDISRVSWDSSRLAPSPRYPIQWC